MASVNAVIHVLAILALIFLAYLLLRLKRQCSQLLSILRSDGLRAPVVFRGAYLRELAGTLRIPWHSKEGASKSELKRVREDVVFEFFRQYAIVVHEMRMSLDQTDDRLEIVVQTRVSDMLAWEEKLSLALNLRVSIKSYSAP